MTAESTRPTPSTTPAAAQDATITPEEEKKEKQPLARITKLTHESLLKSAAVVYPRHSRAEILEIAIQALLGEPQPIVHLRLYDPVRQLEAAALLAETHEFIENKTRAITRARLADKDEQAAASEAIKDLRKAADEVRDQVKEIAADAKQAKAIVAAATQHIAGAAAAIQRLRSEGQRIGKSLAMAKLGKDEKAIGELKAQLDSCAMEHNAVVRLVKILTPTEGAAP
jgi:hypothetical protein